MTLSAGQYSMQCWNSTENPDQINRPRLFFQCLQLIKALQKHFKKGEIAVPSTDTKPTRKGIEICVFSPAGTVVNDDIAEFLTATASTLGLEYRKFVKQDVGITRYFNELEINNVSLLHKPVPEDFTEKLISETYEKVSQFNGYRMNDSWRNGIIPEQRSVPFLIPRTTLKRLQSCDNKQIAGEIQAIIKSIQLAGSETKTSFKIINTLAQGGAVLYAITGDSAATPKLYHTIWHAVLLWSIEAYGASIGGVLQPITAALVGPAYLTLKDALNVLLVINDTSNELLPYMEHLEIGERRVVPDMIPAAVPNHDFVPCGLWVHGRQQTADFSFGTYGDAVGVSFTAGSGFFSVGMNCPNSLLGSHNSIGVINEEQAQKACQMAMNSDCAHGWCVNPFVDVKIADHWGNVNWGRAIAFNGF